MSTDIARNIDAVIFDMDGLTLDTEPISREAWQRAAADFGYTISDDLFMQVIGTTVVDTGVVFRRELGDDFPLEKIHEREKRYAAEYVRENGVPMKPGAAQLLGLLDDRNMPRALATSTNRETALLRLEAAGIIDRFDAIVCGDDIVNGKPAPDIFLFAAGRLDVRPARCLVLEDSDAGVKAAHAAGMTPIMVPDLKAPAEESKALAYRIVSSLNDVVTLLTDRGGL